jgi:uncharacterized protein involved in exopolysaccharide biosynthesis
VIDPARSPLRHSTVGPETPVLDSAEFIDTRALRDFLSLLLGAVRRHVKAVVLLFVVFFGGTFGLLRVLPKTYHTESRILAQRNLVMPALGNPKRAVPIDSDTPTRAVSETILTRDNLVALIKQADLMDRWENQRGPLLHLKDMIVAHLRPPLTDAQRLDGLVGVLERQLSVSTDEATVTISVDWPNAQTAYDLVQTAQENFLEARHATEVSTIGETIAILEGHAANIRATVENTIDQIERTRSEVARPHVASGKPAGRRASGAFGAELSEVKAALDTKRKEVAEFEEARHRQLSQLRTQLSQQKAIYAPAHPAVIDTEQSIKDLSIDPPQLVALKAQEQELSERYIQATELATAAQGPTTGGIFRPKPPSSSSSKDKDAEEDERVEYPKARLKIAADNYEDLLRRIDSARIELDTAQAAFKYRYRVIRPAEIPERPIKPKATLVLAGGALLGILAGMFAALVLDLRGDRIHAAWQVEHRLNLPVLVQIEKR